ncbi:MAG: hypothetical protein JW958_07090 [Candidatus Eisenbacteria bacterium]|nr:hypothetical protein [Candidatus Eisenbacteria bacterium]
MKRKGNGAWTALLVVVAVAFAATQAAATPAVNSVVFHLNIWEDCLTHTVSTVNNYPSQVCINDDWTCTSGYADLHNWHLSDDGVAGAVFNNGDGFRLKAELVISGTGNAEAGLMVAPWWAQNTDGRFNVRTTDGEIACFGGRLPFYSFTVNHGISYVKGDAIILEVIYLPNGLSVTNPATITYNLTYNSVDYTSGPIAFDEGNPAEPYGTWGMLDNARVGGYVQELLGGAVGQVLTTWCSFEFEDLGGPTATEATSWGDVKTLFR